MFYAKESYMNKYGIEPSIEELSQIIEISKKDISDAIIASKPPISISEPIKRYKDGKEVFFDNIMGTDPDELVNKIIENETVREALDRLTPKEREIILLRYGFEEDKIFPQSEIAKMFNVSQPQIFRIEQKALGKLRLLRTT